MRSFAVPVVLAATVLLAAPSARAGDCHVEIGPDDRVTKGETLVIRSGERVENAVSLHGDLVVEGGAVVGKEAVSLGGQVREAKGARIRGSVVGLALQGGKSSLAKEILKGIADLDGCSVIQKGATGG